MVTIGFSAKASNPSKKVTVQNPLIMSTVLQATLEAKLYEHVQKSFKLPTPQMLMQWSGCSYSQAEFIAQKRI